MRPVIHHIPVCPFSQRVKILIELRGLPEAVEFRVVDITRPRDPALLEKAGGTTALPIMELPDGLVLKESLVILNYLDETLDGTQLASSSPEARAVEGMLVTLEGPFADAGYLMVLNQDVDRRDAHEDQLLSVYARMDDVLTRYGTGDPFLFDGFGYAEAVFTPLFMRFWFLDYYEGFTLPRDSRFSRVARWQSACLAHPAAQQVTREEIVKLYYDYAQGAGNGALVPGRSRSSFVFEPDWRERPWPPAKKYGPRASDAELGLLP